MEIGISLNILFHVSCEKWGKLEKISSSNCNFYITLTFVYDLLWKQLEKEMDFASKVLELLISATFQVFTE